LRNLVILGSTGSIGKNALDIVDRYPEKLKVIGLAAGSNHNELARQIEKYNPRYVTLNDKNSLASLKSGLPGSSITVLEDTGFSNAIEEISALSEAEVILNAIVGVAGLRATAAALATGKTVALANKESMVAAGPILNQLLDNPGRFRAFGDLPMSSDRPA